MIKLLWPIRRINWKLASYLFQSWSRISWRFNLHSSLCKWSASLGGSKDIIGIANNIKLSINGRCQDLNSSISLLGNWQLNFIGNGITVDLYNSVCQCLLITHSIIFSFNSLTCKGIQCFISDEAYVTDITYLFFISWVEQFNDFRIKC